MARYEEPTTIEDGMILGRANLGTYVSNRRYWHGLADRWVSIPRGTWQRQFTGTELENVVWQGYHMPNADATRLFYEMTLDGDSRVRMKLYYNAYMNTRSEATLVEEIRGGQRSGKGTRPSGFDLSEITSVQPGRGRLYPVLVTMERTDAAIGVNTKATVTPPYTGYTGSDAFRAPPVLHNGNMSSTTPFSVWKSNDEYFNAIQPPQPPFLTDSTSWGTGGKSLNMWYGVHQYLGPTRLWFYIGVVASSSNNCADNGMSIYYNNELISDGRYSTYPTVTASLQPISQKQEWWEGYYDLTGNYTAGNWYPIYVNAHRGTTDCGGDAVPDEGEEGEGPYDPPDGENGDGDEDEDDSQPQEASADATFYLYYMFAAREGSGVSAIRNPAVGDYVRAEGYLNALSIYDRYCNGRIRRYDWAVRSPQENYRLKRRYDKLYYLGEGLDIEWGTDSTQGLPDATDTQYPGEFDLVEVDGLHYGTIYRITGDSLLYAMEVPY